MNQSIKPAALITGASSGIGKEITHVLLELGYYVYGIGRTFPESMEELDNFCPLIFDLKQTTKLPELAKKIRKEHSLQVLINNAGVGYFGLHEELNANKIHEMVAVNVEAPLILTQLFLRDLKKNQGNIIQISSITAKKSNPHGCAYGATKAALTSFGTSLFDEARKYGVSVTTIHPDMTKSSFYRNADFCEGSSEDSYLLASEVAKTVQYILTQRNGIVVSDITVQPQIHQLTKKKSSQP